MALIKCIDCKSDVSTSAISCPSCGAPVTENKKASDGTVKKVKCSHCHELVIPKGMSATKETTIITGLLLCLGIIPGVVYLVWYGSRRQCRACNMPLT